MYAATRKNAKPLGPVAPERAKRPLRTSSSVSSILTPDSSLDAPCTRLSEAPSRRPHTRIPSKADVEVHPAPRKVLASARAASASALPYTVPSRETVRGLRSERGLASNAAKDGRKAALNRVASASVIPRSVPDQENTAPRRIERSSTARQQSAANPSTLQHSICNTAIPPSGYLRESTRTLKHERVASSNSHNSDATLKGRVSEATRRRMALRASTAENAQSTSRSQPEPVLVQPKRSALGDVVNVENGRPAHASKRVKATHVYSDLHQVEPSAPAKRIHQTRSTTTSSRSSSIACPAASDRMDVDAKKPSKSRTSSFDKENRVVPAGRLPSAAQRTVARAPLREVFRPVETSTPLPYRISTSNMDQMQIRQMNEMFRAKVIRILTPRRSLTLSANSRAVRHATPPLAPKCTRVFPDHVTPEAAIYEICSNGANPFEVELVFLPEYAEEIHAYLRYKEGATCPPSSYAGTAVQPELTWDMRRVLVNWLVQLHAHFNFAAETFYLAVNVMDRFLAKRTVLVHNFHLVAVCALMVAAKYEQATAPPLSTMAAVCEDQYGVGVIKTAERYLLAKLQYDLGWPGPLTFVRRINEGDGFDPRHRILAKYLLELAQLDERFVGIKPSVLAAAAYLAACKILNLAWTDKHTRLATYCPEQLLPYVSALLEGCYMFSESAVCEKYSRDEYYNIARTLPEYLNSAGFVQRAS